MLRRSIFNPLGWATSAGGGTPNSDLTEWNTVTSAVLVENIDAARFASDNSEGLYCTSNTRLQAGAHDLFIYTSVRIKFLTGTNMAIVSKDDNLSKAFSEYLLAYVPSNSCFQFQIETANHNPLDPSYPNDGSTPNVQSSIGVPNMDRLYVILAKFNSALGIGTINVNGTEDNNALWPNAANTTDTAFSIGTIVGSDNEPEGSFFNGLIGPTGICKSLPSGTVESELTNVATVQNENNGTLQSGAAYSSDVPSSVSSYVYSVSFNGATKVSFNDINLDPAASTLCFRIKNTSFGGAAFGYLTNFNTYVRILDSTTIRVQTNQIGTFEDFTVPTMSTGVWYDVMVIRDARYTKVYLNGTESSTGSKFQQAEMTINQLGQYWDGANGLTFTGKMSDVIHFQSVLSPSDISAYTAGTAISVSPFFHLKLNEGSGTTAIDSGSYTGVIPKKWDDLSLEAKVFFRNNGAFWDLDESTGTRMNKAI